jgi:hypothetical protein
MSMVATLGLLAVLTFPIRLSSQDASGNVTKLPDGTPVQLSLQEELNSATAHAGDSAHFEVVGDVRVGNTTVIPSGSAGVGRIADVEHKKRVGRGGKLNFSVDYVKLPDGTSCKVRASAARQGKDKTGTVIAGTLLVSPLFLLMHGKDVDVPKGATFTAYIDGEHSVAVQGPTPPTTTRGTELLPAAPQKAALSLPSAPVPPTASNPPAATAPGHQATVPFKSDPAGADISIDGDYVGSTPESLQLNPGRHAITIEKPGFKPSQRTLSVQPDATITVEGNLEASN